MKERLERLAAGLPEGADAALITSGVSRRYLTGMASSAGTLVIFRSGEAYLVIDSRYIEKARRTAQGCQVVLQRRLADQVRELLERHGARRLAVESDYMTLSEYQNLQRQLPGVELVIDRQLSSLLRQMRAVKAPEELEAIQRAQAVTDAAFTHILDYIRPGRTEREIAGELLDFCYRQGSEGPSFDYIVVSGANSSMPHGVPTGKAVERGDFVTMDFGCLVDGYCSDMTRTVAVGPVDEEHRRVYETVLAAQKAAIAAARPGIPGSQVDRAARQVIEAAGYGPCFGHSTGHSVGLEIHESPLFAPAEETLLQPGMVITVEPGIYLEGKFGVRIEDMVFLTPDGNRDLTHSPKEFTVI